MIRLAWSSLTKELTDFLSRAISSHSALIFAKFCCELHSLFGSEPWILRSWNTLIASIHLNTIANSNNLSTIWRSHTALLH